MRIRIALPDDRDFEGRLEVLDANDAVVFGPVPAAGRAHDEAAATHGNPSRSPLMPYGDTPLGTFAVRSVVGPGLPTGIDADVRGSHGVVLLEPLSGQAALADAHGRFRLFIQGGGDEDGALRATAGAVRLRNGDQAELVALLRRTPGPVLCEVVSAAKQGARVSLATPPLDHDPPPLPGRSYVFTPRPAKSLSRAIPSFAGAPAGYASPMFVVVPERSGSGGTGYGGGGSGSGDGSAGGADTGAPGPLPVGGTDTSPVPGGDLNPPPDNTATTVAQAGGSDLLSTAAPTGLSSPYSVTENGWIVGQQPTDPSTGLPATGNPLAPFVGRAADSFTGATPDSDKPNSYTGGPSVDPATNTTVAIEPDFRGNPVSDPARAAEDVKNIQALMDGAAALDASIAASRAQQPANPDSPAPADTTPQQPSDRAPSPDLNTSPAPPPPQNYTPATSPGQNVSTATPLPDASTSQTYTPDPFPTTLRPDDPLPWTPAGSAGAVSSQGYIPPFESQGVPAFSRTPVGPIGPGPWRGYLGETAFKANSLFGGPLLTDLNTRPFTTATGAPGNPGFFPVLDFQNRVTGNPTSVATSLRGNYNAPGDQGRLGFYRFKYGELVGSENPQKLNTAAQNLGITPNDVVERGFLAINSDDVRAARDFISQDIRNNPGDYPAGLDPNAPYRQIVGNGLTTPQLSNLQQARFGLNNVSAGEISRLTSPEALGVARNGWGASLGGSAARGGGFGAGIATGIDAARILLNPDAHPDAARELATTGVLGAGSGATGSVTEAAFNARFSQSLLAAAGSGEEVGLLTPLLGRVAGGGLGGGVAAPFFTVGQMAASDTQYSPVDYEAKAVRSAAAGIYSGALAAGVVGAIWGTEVPILGNLVGFAVGFGGYLLYDAVFGEQIENTVRQDLGN